MRDTPKGGYIFDLDINESAGFLDSEGKKRTVTLKGVEEKPDNVRGIIRSPSVRIDIDGVVEVLPAAHYTFPRIINGVKTDCPATRKIAEVSGNPVSLYKDARIRCWNPGDKFFDEKVMFYPVPQSMFDTMTQLGNERCYANACEAAVISPGERIYYHQGLDIGGYDKGVPLYATVDGTLIVRGDDTACEPSVANGRYDRIVIQDSDGWLHRYAHLAMIAPSLKVGQKIRRGDYVGILGKEGSSGGWAHLHFGVVCMKPDGSLVEVDAYPFLMESYLEKNPGALIACARPHRVSGPGEEVEVSGINSICDAGKIVSYRWLFDDGETAEGMSVKRVYDTTGTYSAMLTVTDDRGKSDVDFCVIQVLPFDGAVDRTPPIIHLAYYPCENLRPFTQIAFKARTFFHPACGESGKAGQEEWDFGDGATAVSRSGKDYDERWHIYEKPGTYIVTVRRSTPEGISAVAQVRVKVAA